MVESGERLTEQGIARLRDLLDGLSVTAVPVSGEDSMTTPDALVTVTSPHGGPVSGPVLVEAKANLTPAHLERMVRPRVELMRRINSAAYVIMVSPWLSPRTRQVLDDLGYGYLDLTGNASIRLDSPVVLIRLQGAQVDPTPTRSDSARGLTGPQAGRLVRALVDVTGSYSLTELAQATDLSLSYVSRLVSTLEEQGLLTRSGRSIAEVQWPALLRMRAEEYPLMRSGEVAAYLAPQGHNRLLAQLADLNPSDPGLVNFALTGHYAAMAVAPHAVGGQLILHLRQEGDRPPSHNSLFPQRLGLIPAPAGDVLLITAKDPFVLAGAAVVDTVHQVRFSQLVIDCLGGPGRLPAEGEAVLAWMQADQTRWRLRTLKQWTTTRPGVW